MERPLQIVTIAGEERELLYTLSLYKILQDRKQQIIINKGASWAEITNVFLRMIYAAYLNAIEVRQIDEPTYNPIPLKFMDFVVWSETNPKEAGKQIQLCYEFVTGEKLDLKKKSNPTQEETKIQKKKSIWRRIGEKFKIS